MTYLLNVDPDSWRPKTRVYAVTESMFDVLSKKTSPPMLSYSIPGRFENEILLNASANQGEPLFGVYAGYTNSLLEATASLSYPHWYIKGLTELMGASKVTPKRVIIGTVANERISSLLNERWIPLRYLLNVARNDPQLASTDFANHFNAECWFVVHMIVLENKHKTEFDRYFQLLDDGASSEEAFANSFDVSMEELDTELLQALRRREVVTLKISLQDHPATAEPRLLADAEAQGRLALFAAKNSPLVDSALGLSKAALALDPNQNDGLDALALTQLRQADYPGTLQTADRLCGGAPVAAATGSLIGGADAAASTQCATLYADLLYRGAGKNPALGIDGSELAARSRRLFTTAITVNREDLDAWAGLMKLIVYGKDVDAAKNLMPNAKHLWATHANNPAVAEGVGELCYTAGDYASALKFARVWQKHAWTDADRASADAAIARLKTFIERQQLTEAAATGRVPPGERPSN
jgi:hypothetical protein